MDFNDRVSAVCHAKMNKMVPSELTAELETQMMEHNEKLSCGSMYGAIRSQRRDPRVRLEEGTVGKKEQISKWQERLLGVVDSSAEPW